MVWLQSGYCVALWLPQIVSFLMSWTLAPVLVASCDSARLWSRRVIAVKRLLGMSGAWLAAMRALVLAGLPTTSTRTSLAAPAFRASPCGLKMPPLALSRSPRSMPAVRGRAPTSRATLQPSKAALASEVMSMPVSSGKAQSSSSIAVPWAALRAGSISSRRSRTGVSAPSSWPEAMRNSRA